MNYILGNIPYVQIIEYLIAGFVLLLLFNFIGRYIIPLLEKRTRFAVPLWQKIQIVIWSIFLLLFFSELLRYYTAITLIFTVVLLALGWEYWKNIFAGILIKFTEQFKEGDFIATDFIEGTIKKIHLSRSDLINEKGELVIIPNYKLRNKVFTHLHKIHDVNIGTFNVNNPKFQTMESIYQLAYECPYISANQEIFVEKQNDNEFIIKATVIDNSFTESVNNYFENASRSNKQVIKI